MLNYKNPKLSIAERVEDLIGRMTFEEKIDQITCLVTISEDIPNFKEHIPQGIGNVGAFTVSDNVEKIAMYVDVLQKYLVNETRLGIPALIHCEACAGAQFTEADVFPSAIAQASTFEPDLVEKMADIIRKQMLYVGFRQALSPVVDITRDPRWGRITETYGEDATLTSFMASAFVKGIQTDNLKEGLMATAKHYVGHGITEGGLNMGRNLVSERDLMEIHCKPFQCAITEANLASVMNSYCSMNGEPVVGSKKLLTDQLREKMGFSGIVVSDYLSVDRMIDPFRVADTYEEAGIRAIKAGLDVEYPRPKGFSYKLQEEIKNGKLNMEIVDTAVRRVLKMKFALGLFENPYPDLEKLKKELHLESTKKFNEEMAKKSFTLLKNNYHILPLSDKNCTIAVIGPHGDSLRSLFGTFSYPAVLDMTMSREEDGQEFEEPGVIIYDIEQKYVGQVREASPRIEKRIQREFPKSQSLFQALQSYLPGADIKYAKGINCAGTDLGGMQEAVDLAAGADIVILTLGGKNGWGITSTVGEGVDATNIDLPGKQEEFARKIYELHKKTIVLHYDGRPLSNEYVASHFDAIMEVWQPGEMGSQALCKTLFGEYNPAGRLPVTVARNTGQLPIYYGLPRGSGYVAAGHTGMIRNKNGYINDTAFPLYYFGHGLSYSDFEYSDIQLLNDKLCSNDTINLSVKIKNIGNMNGEEVVQFYFSDEVSSMVRPSMELAGFQRVFLKKGETKQITFRMKVSQMAFLNQQMEWIVEEGKVNLLVGASSNDIRLSTSILLLNSAIIDERTRGFYAETCIE
ncbi:MAG: glycoside hydrolase family 3 N-terminal domain-containing protein [Lachnospiraceae bacterium]|nr:glycoside hydrolase family 3 N-terminal domain-containing protein [Lachnospiraceae bacterium]